MEKVEVLAVSCYGWECPKCGNFNLTGIHDDLICNDCNEEFEKD